MNIRDSVADRMDARVLTIVLFVAIIEFEVFTMPRGTVLISGQDAWLSILLGSFLVLFNTYILVKLASRFPRENFFELSVKVWGKPLSIVIIVAYLTYWLTLLAFLLEDFNVVNETYFVREVHPAVSVILMAVGAAWVVLYGFPAVVRLLQMMFPFILIPLIFVFIFQIFHINPDNFRPVLANGFGPVLKGAVLFAGLWQGVEVIFFAAPFLSNPDRALKPALAGIGILSFLALAQSINSIGILGTELIQNAVWPGVDAMSSIQFPGFPVERYELFLTFPWLIAIFTTLVVFLYLFSFGLMQLLHVDHRKLLVFFSAASAAGIAILFPNYAWKIQYFEAFGLATIVFTLLIPWLTFLLAVIRRKGGTELE